MINMIRADIFKLYKSNVIKILFGITTLSSVIMLLMAYLIPQGVIDEKMTGIGFMFSDVNMMSILGAVIASSFICGDFDNKSIHQSIVSGCSRKTVLISKAVVFLTSIGFLLIPYVIITAVAFISGKEFGMGSVAIGFLNMITLGVDNTLQGSLIFKQIIVMVVLLIVYMSQLSICVPLAISLKKPVLVVSIYYGSTILFAQLSSLSKSVSGLADFLSSIPFGGEYSLLNVNSGTGDIVRAVVVSFIFILVMIAISYQIFKKAEVK
jgi:ABC-2 type transport system permease protein